VTARRGARLNPLVVLVVAALIPAALLFGLWRWAASGSEGAAPPPTTVAPPAPSATLSTPLLSFRRAPAVLSRDVNLGPFQAEVDDFAATLDAPGCVSVAVDGVPVGAARADTPLIPASNQKLLVAAAALRLLGEDFTYSTEARAAATPSGGVLAGDLYLVGSGDPLLTSSTYPVANDPNPVTSPTSLDALADAVVAAGVTQIQGRVVGDATRYDDEYYAPSWINDVRGIEAGPYDALMVNDARVTGDPLRASNPAVAAAEEFAQLLQARGVTVGGGAADGHVRGAGGRWQRSEEDAIALQPDDGSPPARARFADGAPPSLVVEA